MCTFWACEKEDVNPNPIDVKDTSLANSVAVDNGMLVFSSGTIFDKTLKELESQEVDGEPIEFDVKFSNFVSSRQAFDLLTEDKINAEGGEIIKFKNFAYFLQEEGESYLEPIVNDAVMSQIVNNEGWFGIEDKVFKVTEDYYLELEAKDYYPQMSLENAENKAVARHEIERKIQEKYTVGYCSNVYSYKNGKQYRKLIASWCVIHNPLGGGFPNFPGTYKVNIKTTNYKRGWGGSWSKKSAYKIQMYGDITIFTDGTFPVV